jgi:formyl-CoA transferase
MSDAALGGVRVLDVATLFPAPLLAAMLGDFGADVVKVEPARGDPLRAIGDVPWALAGRNKRSVVVDFESDDGLAVLHRLMEAADIVVFNQPASLLQRWHCSDSDIAARNPATVVVHLSAFGATGPYSDQPGNGTLAEAFVGLAGGRSVPLGDVLGAITGVVGALAALYWRDARRGHGQVVDVSLYEALLPLLAPALAGVSVGRTVRELYVAADGRSVAISATTGPQVERLDQLTGTDVAAWVAPRTAAEAVEQLVAARVPAIEVNDLEQLRADEHVVVRESISTVDGRTMPAPAPKLSATPGQIRHVGPGVGEHTDAVVAEWLDG